MAKLQAPLFSAAAVGTIGKIISYSRHHGLNTGQKKPEPKDPDTEAQEKQREAFKAASDAWVTLDPSPLDLMAWHTEAQQRKLKIGGRQMFMKLYIIHYLRGQEWVYFNNLRITYAGATSLRFEVEVRNALQPIEGTRTGSRMSGEIWIELVHIGGGIYEGEFNGLTRNKAFHFWPYYNATTLRYGRAGAYYFKTKFV